MSRLRQCGEDGAGRHHAARKTPRGLFVFLALFFFTVAAHGQNFSPENSSVQSVSGQFTVTVAPEFSPLLHRANLATNNEIVRLQPALLAVTAERFRAALWTQLGFQSSGNWSGKIILALHPARTPLDDVNLNIGPLLNVWHYRVELPDVLTRLRFSRALSAVLLLEIANRGNREANHSAELPPWLVDGLAQVTLGGEPGKIILSAPEKKVDGLMQSRVSKPSRGMDPLAEARTTLKNVSAPSFDQLCWPTGAQLDGGDGGAYLAGAQLFTADLLALKNGPEKMRVFLAKLPSCLNWQTAFFAAFHEDFRRALDVEKWWSLRVVRFAARDPGPRWTVAASRERLADLIAVPVELRNEANALPEHGVISLQAAVQNFTPAQRESVLQLKVRDLELAQFRLAPPFSALAAGYRAALADFLGQASQVVNAASPKQPTPLHRSSANVMPTVKKLNALDARRREAELKLEADPLPKVLNQTGR
ncbi:MAG: hypothetical protein RL616_303 [Verrucomicrobiota bacterium]